jgi:rhodanese-related sulfurtransferase
MDKLLEYVTRHPFLVGGTAVLAAAVLVYELSRARSAGQAVGPLDAVRLLNDGALLLDVRSKAEFDSGHVIDARHVPQEDLAGSAETLKKYRDKVVIACCESGMRSSAAARVLKAQGFTRVVNLRGGLAAWRGENLPLVKSDARGRQSS